VIQEMQETCVMVFSFLFPFQKGGFMHDLLFLDFNFDFSNIPFREIFLRFRSHMFIMFMQLASIRMIRRMVTFLWG